MSTNITPHIQEAFRALSSGEFGNFALYSCFVNGEPAAAIVVIDDEGENVIVTPLFVSITPSMTLVNHDGDRA